MALLSANISVCELVLWERNDVPTMVRAMSVIGLSATRQFAHFFSVTTLNCHPGDYLPHSLRVVVSDRGGAAIAQTPPFNFKYGYKIEPSGFGGFILTSEFNLDVNQVALPMSCLVSAFLDNEPNPIALIPLMLRRG
jgi:hypothetical protein